MALAAWISRAIKHDSQGRLHGRFPDGVDTPGLAQVTGVSVPDPGETSADVSWTAVAGATSYDLHLDGVSFATSATASKTLTGLLASTTYSLTVRARNANGAGPFSAAVQFTTDAAVGSDTLAPSVPRELSLSLDGNNKPVLSFYPSADPKTATVIASGLRRYPIHRTPPGSVIANHNAATVGIPTLFTLSKVGSVTPDPSAVLQANGVDITITSAGTDIWGTADEFALYHADRSGDIDMAISVPDYVAASEWAKVGLMIRQSTAAGSICVFVIAYPSAQGRGVRMEYRSTLDGSMTGFTRIAGINNARVLRLKKVGSSIEGFYSVGSGWVSLGQLMLAFSDPYKFGPYVCARDLPEITVAFTQFTYSDVSGEQFTDTTAAASTSYDYKVSAEDVAGNVSAYSSIKNISTSGATTDNFPRIGLHVSGGGQVYPQSMWASMAKFHLVTISGSWETWNPGYSRESIVTGVKALAGTFATRIFMYHNPWEMNPGNPPYPSWMAECNARNTWLRYSGTSGTITKSSFNSAHQIVNPTIFAPLSGGLSPYEWYYDFVRAIGGNYAAPSLDGYFLDNVFWKPRHCSTCQSDYDRDGTADSLNDAAIQQAWRNGVAKFFQRAATLDPTKIRMGNIGDLYNGGTANFSNIAPYQTLMHGGLWEHAIGQPFSPETWAGHAGFMTRYQFTMDAMLAPKYVMFNTHLPNPTDYQEMRYQLTACLMKNGYFTPSEDSEAHRDTDILYFDEYDDNGATPEYLGAAVGAEQTTAAQNGVWIREFVGGYAIHWPPGITASITLPVNVVKINGDQAPSVNNGASISAGTPIAPPGGSSRNGLVVKKA